MVIDSISENSRDESDDRTVTRSFKIHQFQEVAHRVISKDNITLVEIQQRLESEAERLALSTNEVESVLSSLEIPLNQYGQILQDHDKGGCADPDLEAVPARFGVFREWVDQQLANHDSMTLTIDQEQLLVNVGMSRYGLVNVLALHVVRDVATERAIRLQRDLDGASCHATVDVSVPVDQNDPRQLECRNSFRRYLHRFIAQLPEPIITFRAECRLVEAGQLFHGVAVELIKPTINEVALETGARFVSRQQAIEHVTGLMDEILTHSLEIDSEARSQVYVAGTQWGLDPFDVETVIRQGIERARSMAAAHHRRNLWVLISVVVLTITVIGSLLWVFLPHFTDMSQLSPPAAGIYAVRV